MIRSNQSTQNICCLFWKAFYFVDIFLETFDFVDLLWDILDQFN